MKRFSRSSLALLAALATGCAAVPTQHVGVVESFGAVQNETWGPGLHVWAPWTGVHRINCRTLQLEERTETPTGEGLVVGLDVSIVYHVEPTQAKDVFSRYGGEIGLISNVLVPEFRSVIRDVTAGFNAVDLYSGRRELIGRTMLQDMRTRLAGRGVVIEAILLRNVTLPAQVAKAVETKLAADQQAQQMDFVLQKERKEAERKRIEAQGISDFQRIVTAGITPSLLTWKGIEATRELANSPNTKVIIAGGGRNGLPLILNTP